MDRDAIEEMFQAVGPVTIKRMFGGKGIYHQGRILALEVYDEILLKADEESAPSFDAAGGSIRASSTWARAPRSSSPSRCCSSCVCCSCASSSRSRVCSSPAADWMRSSASRRRLKARRRSRSWASICDDAVLFCALASLRRTAEPGDVCLRVLMCWPSEILLYVEGDDDKGPPHQGGEELTKTAVQFGPRNTVLANVYAPNGTILLGANSKANGAFIGKRVHVDQQVELILDSGF